jgi:RNA polymerase sigma-70 factor, ECF subfamily
VTGHSTEYAELDTDVLYAAFRGDGAAFQKIVERYQRPVLNLCYRYIDGADAEDAAQETFVRAFLNRARFDPERQPLPWLLTIARRLCIDRNRSRKPRFHDELDHERLAEDGPAADERLHQKEILSVLSKALETLPEGQREAVVLHHVEGLAYKEIARILEVPMGTVMTWLHRGRARLQASVGDLAVQGESEREGGAL